MCLCGEAFSGGPATPAQVVEALAQLRGTFYFPTSAASATLLATGSVPGPTLTAVSSATTVALDPNTIALDGILSHAAQLPLTTSAYVAPDSSSFNFGTDVKWMISVIFKATGLINALVGKRVSGGDSEGYELSTSSAGSVSTGAVDQGVAAPVTVAGQAGLIDNHFQMATLLAKPGEFVWVTDDHMSTAEASSGTSVMALPSGTSASAAIFSLGRNRLLAAPGTLIAAVALFEGEQLASWDSRRVFDFHRKVRLAAFTEVQDMDFEPAV